MIWKYRPYDNGLDYTLSQMRYFYDEGAMFNCCVHSHAFPILDDDGEIVRDDNGRAIYEYPFTSRDLVISKSQFDDSYINWPQTHYIYTTRYFDKLDEPQIIGMCCPLDQRLISQIKDVIFEYCRLFDYPPDVRREIDYSRKKEFINYEAKNMQVR